MQAHVCRTRCVETQRGPMFGLSFWEITLILVVALLFLGPKRLPGLAKSIGKGLRELRRASSDLRSAIEEPLEEVRRPLEELRGDLTDAVRGFEEEVEREAATEEVDEEDDPYARERAAQEQRDRERAHEDATTELEVEDRRRQVEGLYASFHEQEPQDEPTPGTEPSPAVPPPPGITPPPEVPPREMPTPSTLAKKPAPPPPPSPGTEAASDAPPGTKPPATLVMKPAPEPPAAPLAPEPPDDLFDDNFVDDEAYDEETTAIGAPPEDLINETAKSDGDGGMPAVKPLPPKKPS